MSGRRDTACRFDRYLYFEYLYSSDLFELQIIYIRSTEFLFCFKGLFIVSLAVTWLKYCRYGGTHYPINQSIIVSHIRNNCVLHFVNLRLWAGKMKKNTFKTCDQKTNRCPTLKLVLNIIMTSVLINNIWRQSNILSAINVYLLCFKISFKICILKVILREG